MATIDRLAHEIRFTIVYDGPGLAGGTTNIRHFHAHQPEPLRGQLVYRSTETECTLSYSFVPATLKPVDDLTVRLTLFTSRGSVFHAESRKDVLRGADGVIFVADSQEMRHEANLESFETLVGQLGEVGVNIDELPLTFQYNKRDLGEILSIEQIDRDLNPRRRPSFASVAYRGTGVDETLNECVHQVIARQGGPYRGSARS